MATSVTPIVWDFYRQVSGASGLGGLFEYADTTSQSIYLGPSVKTRVATIQEGHWEDAVPGSEIELFPTQYEKTDWDNPSTSLLSGAAIINDELYYIRSLGAIAPRT